MPQQMAVFFLDRTTYPLYSTMQETLGPFSLFKITDHANSFSNQHVPPRMLVNGKKQSQTLTDFLCVYESDASVGFHTARALWHNNTRV